MFHTRLLELLVLGSLMAYVHGACRRCLPMEAKEKFCQAHFASVFRINDNGTVIGTDRVYEVEMLMQYRNTYVPKNRPGTGKLFTPADSRACGTIFIKGAYYIVSGYYNDIPGHFAQMVTTRCWLQQYSAYNPVPVYTPPSCIATEPEI